MDKEARMKRKTAVVMYCNSLGLLAEVQKHKPGLVDRIADETWSVEAAVLKVQAELERKRQRKRRLTKKAPSFGVKPKARPVKAFCFGGKRALLAAGRNYVRDLSSEDLEEFDGQSEAMDIAMCITGLSLFKAECWADYVYEGMCKERDKQQGKT